MVTKASFIGEPVSNTVLYVGIKLENKLQNLEAVEGCLVFVESGMTPSESLRAKHEFRFSDNPVLEYARYAQEIATREFNSGRERKIVMTDEGYYRGEGVVLGRNVYIEPGAFIGHDVRIGDDTIVLTHAVIKHATIGSQCLIKEHAQIGAQGFTMVQDEEGNEMRIPCLGAVCIHDHVEVGSFTTVCRGQNTDTTLSHHVKIDDHVHVGHDVHLGSNTIIAAAATLGGYDKTGANAYVGLNATIKQLVTLTDDAQISMGSRIAKDVTSASGMYGMPR
ncbi:hypothetical protein [Raoultibacter phocaeensis]|uniref:hypothetical protein n=1 Tax=Raoultibacter phocaeensis TaxID=2479841 RepID=UPI0015D5A928|nr:hypothetical protein [Raoultibacter phocaeensis]